ncbi:MAG: MFS transporter [Nitrososphaerales archaeon]
MKKEAKTYNLERDSRGKDLNPIGFFALRILDLSSNLRALTLKALEKGGEEITRRAKRRLRMEHIWLLSSLPANAALAGLNILVPLYILSLGGNVLDVALIVSLFHIALTLGSLLWGYFIDRFEWRKHIILISYFGFLLCSIFTFLFRELWIVALFYPLMGFLSVGPQPVTNLLIMETVKKERWGRVFARAQLIATLGLMVGVLVGVAWIALYELPSFFLGVSLLSTIATILAYWLIKEPPLKFERHMMARSPHSLIHRLFHPPILFLKYPSLEEFKKFVRRVKVSLTRELPLFFFSIFLFYTSGSLYFTSLIPFMKERNISDTGVFSAFFGLHLTKVLFFPLASRLIERNGEMKMALLSFLPRVGGTLLTVLSALYFSDIYLLIMIMITLVILDVAFPFFHTATSVLLFKLLHGERRGEILGLFSAFTGAGLLIGSITSGLVSASFGFPMTFSLATLLLLGSFFILRLFSNLRINKNIKF